MNKNKKRAITIISVILGVIVVFLASGAGVYHFYVKPKLESVVERAGDDNGIDANKILDEVEQTIQEEDVQNYINENNPNESEELKAAIEEAKQRNEQQKQEEQAQTNQKPKTKYEKIKEQVAPADLKDGMALASKVDAGYILGLLSGGLTPEEKHELKTYLTSRLSGAEISRGIQLFSKYSYLL